jgi:hypothetical protein
MKAAIAQLKISLDVLTTNEPINRAEGNTEQADVEAENASEIRQALAVLEAANAPRLTANTRGRLTPEGHCEIDGYVLQSATGFPRDGHDSFTCSPDETQSYIDILKIAEKSVNEVIELGASSVRLQYVNIPDFDHNPEGKIGQVRTVAYKFVKPTKPS